MWVHLTTAKVGVAVTIIGVLVTTLAYINDRQSGHPSPNSDRGIIQSTNGGRSPAIIGVRGNVIITQGQK